MMKTYWKKSFSLIEVLIAIALITFIIFIFYKLLNNWFSTSNIDKNLYTKTQIADAIMTNIRQGCVNYILSHREQEENINIIEYLTELDNNNHIILRKKIKYQNQIYIVKIIRKKLKNHPLSLSIKVEVKERAKEKKPLFLSMLITKTLILQSIERYKNNEFKKQCQQLKMN